MISRHERPFDGSWSYLVDVGIARIWLECERRLSDVEEQLLTTTAQVGGIDAVHALALPFTQIQHIK